MNDPPATLRDLYDSQYQKQVRRAALIVGDLPTAEDIVGDVFVALAARWGRVDAPDRYLSRAVLNRCRNEFRRRRRLRRLPETLDDPSATDEHRELSEFIAALPYQERATLVLRFYDDLSYAEIAEVLKCAPGSVGPRIARALDRLKGALEDDE